MLFPHPAFWGRLALAFACALGLSTSTHAEGVNDTGIADCWTFSDVVTGVEVDTGSYPRQDCRYGRDAAAAAGMPKIGGGGKGFDFSKIANDGTVLPESAALGSGAKDWACTRDNVTGITWEVKTTSGLRSQSHTYTWYNSNAASNGGEAGITSGGTCNAAGRCDTEKFVTDVNAASLCSATNWRMPGVKELEGIVDFGRLNPAIDPSYFPDIPILLPSPAPSSIFRSGSPVANHSDSAWCVDFYGGDRYPCSRSSGGYVRLVRGGP
jgi:hypothetical protein